MLQTHSLPTPPHQGGTGCSYEYPGGKCPKALPTVSCKADSDCKLPVCGKACTCRGKASTCRDGTCASGPGSELCWDHKPAGGGNETATSGGVQLFVNMETSVVGFVAIEVLDTPGFTLAAADPLKGSATDAVASWGGGMRASLSSLAGREVTLRVTLTDAKLFSLRLGCAGAD